MRIKVRVTPRSREEGIVGARADGAIQVRVTAAPEEGKANEAVLRLLSEALGLPRGSVRLKAGGSGREKWIDVDGMDERELKRRLKI